MGSRAMYSVIAVVSFALFALVVYVETVGYDKFVNAPRAFGSASESSAQGRFADLGLDQCDACHMQHCLASAANRFDRYYPGFHVEQDWDFYSAQGPFRIYRYKDATFAGKAEFARLKVFALTDGAALVTTVNEDAITTLL